MKQSEQFKLCLSADPHKARTWEQRKHCCVWCMGGSPAVERSNPPCCTFHLRVAAFTRQDSQVLLEKQQYFTFRGHQRPWDSRADAGWLNQCHMFAWSSETQTDFPNEIINIPLYKQGLKIASVHFMWHRATIWHLECCLQGVVELRWLITATKLGWEKQEEVYRNNKDKFFTLGGRE